MTSNQTPSSFQMSRPSSSSAVDCLPFAIVIRKKDGKKRQLTKERFYDLLDSLICKCWCCAGFCQFYLKKKLSSRLTLSDWFDLHSSNEKCPFIVVYSCPNSTKTNSCHLHLSQTSRIKCQFSDGLGKNKLEGRFNYLETKYLSIKSSPNACRSTHPYTDSGLEIPIRTYSNLQKKGNRRTKLFDSDEFGSLPKGKEEERKEHFKDCEKLFDASLTATVNSGDLSTLSVKMDEKEKESNDVVITFEKINLKKASDSTPTKPKRIFIRNLLRESSAFCLSDLPENDTLRFFQQAIRRRQEEIKENNAI